MDSPQHRHHERSLASIRRNSQPPRRISTSDDQSFRQLRRPQRPDNSHQYLRGDVEQRQAQIPHHERDLRGELLRLPRRVHMEKEVQGERLRSSAGLHSGTLSCLGLTSDQHRQPFPH